MIENLKDVYRMYRAYKGYIKSQIIAWFRYKFDKDLKREKNKKPFKYYIDSREL